MSDEQQPWMVLAAKPAPLAGLLQSASQRKRALPGPADSEDSGDGQRPVDDVGTSPAP